MASARLYLRITGVCYVIKAAGSADAGLTPSAEPATSWEMGNTTVHRNQGGFCSVCGAPWPCYTARCNPPAHHPLISLLMERSPPERVYDFGDAVLIIKEDPG